VAWSEEYQQIQSPTLHYAFAVVAVAIAVAISFAVEAYQLRDVGPPVLVLVVGIVTWYAGNGPGAAT